MVGYREVPIERVPLHRKGVYVVATSFGNKNWDCIVGQVVEYKKSTVEVLFKEAGQEFSWRFSLNSGQRTQDVGASSGWKISLDDLKEWKPPSAVHKPKVRMKKVHEELVELLNGNETVVWQVFKDETTGRFYFKSFRRSYTESGKVREFPYAAPLEKLLEILAQFVTNW